VIPKDKKYYAKLYKNLDSEANTWIAHWQDLATYNLPRRGRYLSGDTQQANDGSKKHQKIINNTSLDAIKVLAAGMQSGNTSPSRPWFALKVNDKKLMALDEVKEWLHEVRDKMLSVFASSNFYRTTYSVYREMGVFGTGCVLIDEDFESLIDFKSFTIGSYRLALDARGDVSVLGRKFSYSTRQMVEAFGLDACSDSVKLAHQNQLYEQRYEVVHLIIPNPSVDPRKKDYQGKPYLSVYYEATASADKLLRLAGYKQKPFAAPRWDVTSDDIYGDSPAMDALGDTKQLQKMEELKLKALAKLVDPPMNAPSALKGKALTIVAGGVNYHDQTAGQGAFTPAYQVNPQLDQMSLEFERVERRIKRAYYNDLFLAVISENKTMTATEIAKRYEEKLVMLGPVLERIQSEFLNIVVDRAFTVLNDLGVLPPPPDSLRGQDLKIEYIGLLAQAQKAIGTVVLEQALSYVANVAAVKPDALDKFNADEAIDVYTESIGVPPNVINSDIEVAQLREARARQQQIASAQANASALAQTAKTASETVMDQGSALDVFLGR
jgi:hypothetical protein